MQLNCRSTVKFVKRPCHGQFMVGIGNRLCALSKDRIESGVLIERVVSSEVILSTSLGILPSGNSPSLTIQGGIIWNECLMRLVHFHLVRSSTEKGLRVSVHELHPRCARITN